MQNVAKNPVKVPPPVPSKPRQVNLPFPGAGTFPGKGKVSSQQQRTPLPQAQSNTLPLPSKQETPPAATVRPFTPEPKDTPIQKPQTVAASSIYSMYTKQSTVGKSLQQSVQGALNRSHNRSNFVSSEWDFSYFSVNDWEMKLLSEIWNNLGLGCVLMSLQVCFLIPLHKNTLLF